MPTNADVPDTAPLVPDDVRVMQRMLVEAATGEHGVATEDPAARVELLRALEELVSAATAVKAVVALEHHRAAYDDDARAGVPAGRRGRGVEVELGLAVRESPARARTFLGAARAWCTEMPHTFAALRSGQLSPWRATLLAKETAHLPVEDRAQVDAEICADVTELEGLGTAALVARVRRRAAELDPAAAVARARRAAGDRTVSIRPAPDAMTYVTALLPVAQGVAVHAALCRAADSARAGGDGRSRGQLMADVLVERATGQASADAVPVTVDLIVSDATLIGGGHGSALVLGSVGGSAPATPVPAQIARELVAQGLDTDAAWLRSVYVDPGGRVTATTSSARFYAGGLADLLRLRDQGMCRTPYCDAPLRHLDHVVRAADGGPTTADGGQGLCEACNQAKEALRLQQAVDPDAPRHEVVTTTRTGHRYRSRAPAPPQPAAGVEQPTGVPPEPALERALAAWLQDALAHA